MQSHRDWLLAQHGSVCAYCGTETPDNAITLDHVRKVFPGAATAAVGR